MARTHETTIPQTLPTVADAPLIAVPDGEDGTLYFATEEAANAARSDVTLRDALDSVGTFADLSWDEAEAELARIRHGDAPPAA